MSALQGVLQTMERNQRILAATLTLRDQIDQMQADYQTMVLGGGDAGDMSQRVYVFMNQMKENMQYAAANVARLNAQLEELRSTLLQ